MSAVTFLKSRASVVLSALVVVLVTAPAAPAAESARPAVMVLGSFHFKGSTSDEISVTMGDVKAPRRQAEIEAVVERLARFAPTRIAVELSPEHEAAFNEKYRNYRAGKHELSANERQQIGMRLAKKLGHEKLYAVDASQDMDIPRVFAAAEAAGQSEELARLQTMLGELEAELKQVQSSENTILDALRFHNGPLLENGNAIYMLMAAMGSAEDPAGPEVVGKWYERNLKIYANVMRLADSPKERILVIYGSGHGPHLNAFFDQNPEIDLVPALTVLGE